MPKEPLNPKGKERSVATSTTMDVFRQHAEDIGFTTVTVPYAELYVASDRGSRGMERRQPNLKLPSFRDIIILFTV